MSSQTTLELTLVFLRRPGELLLAMKKRGFGEGKWNGAGGKVEAGETVEEAMVRECREEIGVTPTVFEQIADITFNEIHNGERKFMHAHVFMADEWSGEPTESEEMKPQWFEIENIPYTQMWQDDAHWLPLVLEGKKLLASFTYNETNQITDKTIQIVSDFAK